MFQQTIAFVNEQRVVKANHVLAGRLVDPHSCRSWRRETLPPVQPRPHRAPLSSTVEAGLSAEA